MKNMKYVLTMAATLLALQGFAEPIPGRWSVEQAQTWQKQNGWPVGCNYIPFNAVNQLEMWQADTFDPKTIDKELALAEELGFNTLRVYLHDLLWQQDPQGLLKRMDEFLSICDSHGIKVMFVFFDSCWDPNPNPGKQKEPTPHLHNPGWLQSPGVALLGDPAKYDRLKGYVTGVVSHFKDDQRILAWDVFNEPDNMNDNSYAKHEIANKPEFARQLLEKTVGWIREIKPAQPLTSAPWWGDWSSDEKLAPIQRTQLENSDVISFHCYDGAGVMRERIAALKRFGRPILCSEYMARSSGSTFEIILPILKQENVAAYNWGFVAGKSQTQYSWDSWLKKYADEPGLWFCDIYRPDGTAYDESEVALIKKLTGKQ